MGKREFIIDCDTGTDDAIALIAAVYNKDINVRAITSVNGNVKHEYTSRNNLALMEYLDIDYIEVAKGAEAPLFERGNYYGPTHGVSGLGNIELPEAKRLGFSELGAVELILREAEKCEGELELLVIGPMTNIAIALTLYPQLKKLIKHIWIMGGAIKGGNVTTACEFNIWVDPVAARTVLKSGIPMTMVGLDVTERAALNSEDSKRLREMGTKASILVADIVDYMLERYKNGGEDALMHDALALAAALCPDCLKFNKYFADVECEGKYTAGHTSVDVGGKSGKEPNVSFAEEIDLPLFKEWLIDSIAGSRL